MADEKTSEPSLTLKLTPEARAGIARLSVTPPTGGWFTPEVVARLKSITFWPDETTMQELRQRMLRSLTAAAMREWKRQEKAAHAKKRRWGIQAAMDEIVSQHPEITCESAVFKIPEDSELVFTGADGRQYEVYRDAADTIYQIDIKTRLPVARKARSLELYFRRARKKVLGLSSQ